MRVEGRVSKIAGALLAHYDVHARRLPWRAPPGTNASDPYRVWLSEVMLQQTTVAAVGPYFAKFTTSWPTVEELAAAQDADVMAAWAGLGYYARARNLLSCARAVVRDHGGRFPDSEEGLRGLPGVGAYTAAAVAAIAFGRRAVVVDANVERVVAELAPRVLTLANHAKKLNVAVTIDAEEADRLEVILDIIEALASDDSLFARPDGTPRERIAAHLTDLAWSGLSGLASHVQQEVQS